MKNILLCIAIVWGSSLSAQYVPFPEDSATWVYEGYYSNYPGSVKSYHEQLLVLDVFEADSVTVVKCHFKGRVSSKVIYYQNDTAARRVYLVEVDTTLPVGNQITQRKVWYDFNQSVGDTIYGPHFLGPGDTGLAVLDSIGVRSINGTPLRHYYYSGYVYDSLWVANFAIIEGIGSTWDLMNVATGPYFEFDLMLVCFKSFAPPYSFTPGGFFDSSECWRPTIGRREQISVHNGKIYPNPSSGVFILEWPSGQGVRHEDLLLFDAQGRQVPVQIHQIGAGQWQLDLSSRSRGLYFLHHKEGSTGYRVWKILKE